MIALALCAHMSKMEYMFVCMYVWITLLTDHMVSAHVVVVMVIGRGLGDVMMMNGYGVLNTANEGNNER